MKNFIFALVVVSASMFVGQKGSAQDADMSATFLSAIDSMGDEIVKYVHAQNKTAQVAVGTFVGPSPSSTNAGARIVVSLRKHLNESVRLGDSGAYNISGEFRGQKMDGKFVTIIEAAIKDGLGTQLHRLRKKIITDEEEGIAFFGPTSLDLTSNGSVLTSNEQKTTTIIDSIVNPTVNITENVARPSSGSPYGIELLLKTARGYKSMPLNNDGRLAKVGLSEHDIYGVRIYNDSKAPIGVKLSIDGINVFAMSENPSYNGKDITMALCPCSKSTIKGWHLTNKHSAEFQVARFGETAAATFGAFENMGTITARFFRATPNGKLNCPPCERTRSLGTKLGQKTKMDYGHLDVRFGELLGAVSARYVKTTLPTDLPPQ